MYGTIHMYGTVYVTVHDTVHMYDTSHIYGTVYITVHDTIHIDGSMM